MVVACAAAETTAATVSIVDKVSESSLSQVGPVQFGQLTGQPTNQLSYKKAQKISFTFASIERRVRIVVYGRAS